MGFRPSLMLITTALLLAACGSERITVQSTLPAQRVDLAGQGVKRIAIGTITDTSGPGGAPTSGGDAIGDDLRGSLVGLNRFEILDRSAVQALLQEHQLNASGLVDSTQAAETGKFSGATALILGSVTTYAFSEQLKSTRHPPANGQNGYTEYQRVASAAIEASFKIVDVSTGRLVAVTPCRADLSLASPGPNQVTIDTQPAEIDPTAAMAELRRRVVAQFVNDIAPHQISYAVDLATDSDVPELEAGNKEARIGEWASATEQYRKATSRVPNNPSAHYNLGIALRSQGDFDHAIDEFKAAYRLKDDKLYQDEIARTKLFAAGAAQH